MAIKLLSLDVACWLLIMLGLGLVLLRHPLSAWALTKLSKLPLGLAISSLLSFLVAAARPLIYPYSPILPPGFF